MSTYSVYDCHHYWRERKREIDELFRFDDPVVEVPPEANLRKWHSEPDLRFRKAPGDVVHDDVCFISVRKPANKSVAKVP